MDRLADFLLDQAGDRPWLTVFVPPGGVALEIVRHGDQFECQLDAAVAVELFLLDQVGDGERFAIEFERAFRAHVGLREHREKLSRMSLHAGSDAAHRPALAEHHQRLPRAIFAPQQPTDRIDPLAIGAAAANLGGNSVGDDPVHDFPRGLLRRVQRPRAEIRQDAMNLDSQRDQFRGKLRGGGGFDRGRRRRVVGVRREGPERRAASLRRVVDPFDGLGQTGPIAIFGELPLVIERRRTRRVRGAAERADRPAGNRLVRRGTLEIERGLCRRPVRTRQHDAQTQSDRQQEFALHGSNRQWGCGIKQVEMFEARADSIRRPLRRSTSRSAGQDASTLRVPRPPTVPPWHSSEQPRLVISEIRRGETTLEERLDIRMRPVERKLTRVFRLCGLIGVRIAVRRAAARRDAG